ncbi:uncharacterized protein SCHCODRAFT_02683754 [Schizophyllum commune H4-8]|uniref:uncharacterized protein n=1 Tax=Schizophyllum commune (strain H4-8 / FGSC 9210) TaxID=578458 RepID=UPI00215F0602|nr:uncharacterized protein SCHCODRAFT_02683754 [Schizophyllum commune H4-8]KAI5897411.1 hypothetical protein SCHCODRAFT_02683754 [Schizophyllum commune H4-8]
MVTVIPSVSKTLRSRYAPSETEKAALVSDIFTIDSWLTNLDLDINAIEERLAAVRKVRAQVAVDRDKKYSLLAPIRRLPNEVFTLIIRAAFPNKWRSEGSCTSPFPLIDSCYYRLRSLAHSMPELWVRLLWPTKLRSQQTQGTFLARAQLCNERARNEGLDLVVPNFRLWLSDQQDCPEGNRAMHWISTHVDRFRTLDLYVQYNSQPTDAVSAPLLEYARLCTTDHIILGREDRSFGIKLDAPYLRKLELYHLLAPSRVHIPWALLEDLTLEIKCFGLADLNPLQLCTSLKDLRFGKGSYWPEDEHNDQGFMITLGALRTLSLGECGLRFCKFLVVPRLEELVLQPGHECDMPAVRTMLWNSGHPGENTLQSIALATHWCTGEGEGEDAHSLNGQEYLSVLRCTPAVRHLKLSYYWKEGLDLNVVLRALIVAPGERPTLLPLLERVSIQLKRGFTTFDEECVALLKEVALSRWATDDGTHVLRLWGAWPEELKERGILVDQVPCKSVASEWYD